MSKKQVAGYILDRRVGKGSYATVWRGRVEGADPEEIVAIKVISRQTVTETSQLRQEVDVLRRISHPNIVRFRDLKKSASHFYLVLEYCAGGDLSQFLRRRGRVTERQFRRLVPQIASGLCALHSENVLHRDLKPQNILLSDSSEDPLLKIADFGFSRALLPQDMAATVCGSPLYMAPEILRHEPYDARADLWSVGTILYELLVGHPPFSGANPMQLLANIEKSGAISFEQVQVSLEGQNFLRKLLARSPPERLSSREFQVHPYVQLSSSGEAQAVTMTCPEVETVVFDGAAQSLQQPKEWVTLPPRSSLQQASCGASLQHGSPVICGGAPPSSAEDGGVTAAADFRSFCLARSPGPLDPALVAQASLADDGRWATPVGGTPIGFPRLTTEEEFVLLTAQQPRAVWSRIQPPPRVDVANHFCGNLLRTADVLEQLADTLQEPSPVEALALLLRALSLHEKVISVSLADGGATEHVGRAFNRVLEAAEAVGRRVRSACSGSSGGMDGDEFRARPDAIVFDFAVQLALDAAVVLSKGQSCGAGWEAPCHEKLSLSLLLLELLASEAGDEDLASMQAYIPLMARLVREIGGRRDRLGGNHGRPFEASSITAETTFADTSLA